MYRWILCAELDGSGFCYKDVFQNVLLGVSILEVKGEIIRSVALPVLGAGNQNIESLTVMKYFLPTARDFLNRSRTTDSIFLLRRIRKLQKVVL